MALSLTILGTCITDAVAFGVVAPVGYRAFCQRFTHDDLCRDRPAAVTLPLTPWLEKFLGEINVYWNHRLTWTSDETLYGRPEFWTVPTGTRGDCEDYALAKYGQLRRLGIPGGALSLIYGKLKSTGEGHAALAVHTDHGLLVLGSDFDAVLPLATSEIAAVLVEDARRPEDWNVLGPNDAGDTIVADH
jgi:predicted transglutaminase-like cysteine proteinase